MYPALLMKWSPREIHKRPTWIVSFVRRVVAGMDQNKQENKESLPPKKRDGASCLIGQMFEQFSDFCFTKEKNMPHLWTGGSRCGWSTFVIFNKDRWFGENNTTQTTESWKPSEANSMFNALMSAGCFDTYARMGTAWGIIHGSSERWVVIILPTKPHPNHYTMFLADSSHGCPK